MALLLDGFRAGPYKDNVSGIMARAVIGGLITSTLLTLFVVPVMYTYLDDLGRWVTSKLTSAGTEPHGVLPEPAIGD